MVGWYEFESWMREHGIDARRCDRIEMVMGGTAGNRPVAVWLKVHQYAQDEDGNLVYDTTKNEVLWEEVAVPLVDFPEERSDAPIHWDEW